MGNRQCRRAVDRLDKAGKLKDFEERKESTKERERMLRALLLGGSGAGKSTLKAQAQLLYGSKPFAYDNDLVRVLLRQQVCRKLHQHVQSSAGQEASGIEMLLEPMDEEARWGKVRELVLQLWSTTKDEHRCKTDVNLQILMHPRAWAIIDSPKEAVPINLALMARQTTTGIIETELCVPPGGRAILVDVGGPRNERRKWIHCFEDVSAVFFCCNIASYDERLYEDESWTVFGESIALAKDLFSSKWFTDAAKFVFFTHLDEFVAKANAAAAASRDEGECENDQTGDDRKEEHPHWNPDFSMKMTKLIESAVIRMLGDIDVTNHQPIHVFCFNALETSVVHNVFEKLFRHLQKEDLTKPILKCKVLLGGKALLYLRGLGVRWGTAASLMDLCMEKVASMSDHQIATLPQELRYDLESTRN